MSWTRTAGLTIFWILVAAAIGYLAAVTAPVQKKFIEPVPFSEAQARCLTENASRVLSVYTYGDTWFSARYFCARLVEGTEFSWEVK